MSDVVTPEAGFDDAFFWEGVARGELVFQSCPSCGAHRHPPRPVCPECHSLEYATTVCEGSGTVLSWIIPRHPAPDPGAERIVVLVELDEGIRMVSNLIGVSPDEVGAVANGMRVRATFADVDGVRLPQFVPEEA